MLDFLKALFRSRGKEDAGTKGEELAATWLQRERAFAIVARNWRSPRDRREEIDLVGRERDVLVFVEVKAREPGALVPGFYAVNERKKRVLRRAIRSYLARLPQKPHTFRFDIVEVILPPDGVRPPEILHFVNVALFSKSFRG